MPRRAGGPFLEPIGPIFRRPEEGGARFGIRIEQRHCNNQAVAHGGMLATIADIVLGIGGAEQAGTPGHFVTISLVTDYLAPAPLGAWLECHPALLRRTSRMMFVEGRFLADGAGVARERRLRAAPPEAGGRPPLEQPKRIAQRSGSARRDRAQTISRGRRASAWRAGKPADAGRPPFEGPRKKRVPPGTRLPKTP